MTHMRSRLSRRFNITFHATLAVALAGACTDTSEINATRVIPGSVAYAQGPVTAELFAPGVISDAQEEWRITFTPDGHTAYFARSAGFFPVTRQATIYETHLVKGEWTTPTMAPFSGVYSDIDPFIAPNGQRLYFSSIRPVNGVTRGDVDIWMVERTRDGWGEPVRLGPEINTLDDELYPSATANGTLYFAGGPLFPQPGRHFDIYSAERAGDGFAARQALGPAINTTPVPGGAPQDAWEFNPEISVDGKTLVFTSLRPGGFGLGDLYVSHLVKGAWTTAQNLGPLVNTAADEFHPTLTRNKQELFFVRRIPRRGDFYHISTSVLALF